MPFFRRLLSGDYRRAVAAEAAGDYGEAARHYGLCGERDKVAEMHLLRAERATGAVEAIEELRDAFRWADVGTDIRRRVAAALGTKLLERARAEGAATARDQRHVREAASFLDMAGEHQLAGKALELIGDDEAAARSYEQGGLVDEMEEVLSRARLHRRQVDRLRDGFARYGLALAGGRRDEALAALRECEEAAEEKGEYRALREALETRLLSGGAVAFSGLARRLLCASAAETRLGRDPDAHFALRGAGLSRAHATLRVAGEGFHLRDAGSRLGTWLGGLRLDGEVPLAGAGVLRLGDECELSFVAAGGRLRLEVARGLDRGSVLLAFPPGASVDLTPEGLPAKLRFVDGKPLLEGHDLRLNGAPSGGAVQLVRKDVVAAGGVEVEIS